MPKVRPFRRGVFAFQNVVIESFNDKNLNNSHLLAFALFLSSKKSITLLMIRVRPIIGYTDITDTDNRYRYRYDFNYIGIGIGIGLKLNF